MRLNIVFHRVVIDRDSLENVYDITVDYYTELIARLEESVAEGTPVFTDFKVYFDDGYRSFVDFIYPLIENDASRYVLAIPSGLIGQDGRMGWNDLMVLKKRGVHIASHGVSHAALAFYNKNDRLMDTTNHGVYQNVPYGRKNRLSAQEVLYQYIESKKELEKRAGVVDEFVLPYGIYNEQVIALNRERGIYRYISTCDEYLDTGEELRPRYVVDNKWSVQEVVARMSRLRQRRL